MTRFDNYYATISGRSQTGTQFGSWHTNMTGLELRLSSRSSRWSFGGSLYSSPQTTGTGTWSFLSVGNDNFWSVDTRYRLTQSDRFGASLMAGYGHANWDSTFLGGFREAFTSSGPMVGVNVGVMAAPRVKIGADFRYFPWNSTRLISLTSDATSSASGWDGRVQVSYMLNRNVAIDAGYRWMAFNAGDVAGCPGCRFEWNGMTAGLRYNWASDNTEQPAPPRNPTQWRVVPSIQTYFASAWGRTAGGAQFATWHNNLSGVTVSAMPPLSRWRFHGEYYSSPQHSMSWGSSVLDRGSDNFYSAEAKYMIAPWAHLGAGYGYYNWDTTFVGGSREAFSSSGPFAGVHVGWPISPNVMIGGDARFFPSNGTRLTSGGVETQSSGSAYDGNIHLTYRPAGGNLDFQGGYRWVNLNAGDVAACPGCQFGWSGLTGSIRLRF